MLVAPKGLFVLVVGVSCEIAKHVLEALIALPFPLPVELKVLLNVLLSAGP